MVRGEKSAMKLFVVNWYHPMAEVQGLKKLFPFSGQLYYSDSMTQSVSNVPCYRCTALIKASDQAAVLSAMNALPGMAMLKAVREVDSEEPDEIYQVKNVATIQRLDLEGL